jgi:hypothetical protein
MLTYTVSDKGPVATPAGETFQPGNTLQLPEGSKFATAMVAAGLLVESAPVQPRSARSDNAQKKQVEAASATAPAKKRHRNGLAIILENTRVVNGRAYKHIKLENGSEMDLTDEEYKNEVVIVE